MHSSRRNFIKTVSLGGATAWLPSLPAQTHEATEAMQQPATAEANHTIKDQGVQRLIIDSDTATDDALALLLALTSRKVKVEAVTITVGNAGFEQQTKNALYTIEMAGKAGQVPVYQGSARPIVREVHDTATYVHGSDGMSDSFFPDPKQQPEKEFALGALIRLLEKYPNEITLVAIGPQGELTRGAILIDERGVWNKPPNASICMEADEAKFKKMVFDTLKLA